MKHQTSKILSAIFFMLLGISVSIAQAQSPQETLNKYISDLQKNPNDSALREKIIKHVQTMKPMPTIPEDAERFMARGIAAMKGAKSADDFKDAVKEFEKASLLSPWLANAYYNLGVAQDKAGLYVEAIRSLKLYLLAAPDASDAKTVKNLIYEIEYRQEKAAKESSPEAIAAKKKNGYEAWLKKLDGAQWQRGTATTCEDLFVEIHGREIRKGLIVVRPFASDCLVDIYGNREPLGYIYSASIQQAPIVGREFEFSNEYGTTRGTISEDGEVLIEDYSPSAFASSRLGSTAGRTSYYRVRSPRFTLWK